MKMLDAIDQVSLQRFSEMDLRHLILLLREDCAYANICAMKADVVNKNYNVGTGFRTSLKELAEKLIQLTGTRSATSLHPVVKQPLVRNRIGDPTLAEKDIGIRPK